MEFSTDGAPAVVSTRVYARSDNPSSGPIVGIDTLEGGGFSPWGANLSSAQLQSITDSVIRDGDAWQLPGNRRLEEVAAFSDESMRLVTDGWQLNFVDGSATATLQAEPDASVWVWVSRVLRHQSIDEQPDISPIEVLGNDGLLIGDEAFWEAEGFAYRLVAGELNDNTEYSRPAEPIIDDLEIVDRAEWNAAVDRASSTPGWTSFLFATSLAAVAAWLIASALLVIRQPGRRLLFAGLGLIGFVLWWATAPAFVVTLVMLAGVVLGLRIAGFGWSRSGSSRQSETK